MAPATPESPITVELSSEARERVDWFIERTLQSLSAKAGEKVKLICGHSITRMVLKELQDATMSWTLNTEPLTMDPSRVFYYKENLDITDLVPADSGVYACVVTWGADDTVKQNVTLGVFSLEVETITPTTYTFENEPTKMDCHSVTLGELFPDAVRYWLYNGTHTSTLPVTKASNKTVDVIAAAQKSMSGVWECQVLQARTQRVWASAWYNLSVQDPPSSADRAFHHMQDNWYTWVVTLSIVVVLLTLLCCFSAYKLKGIQDRADEKFRDERLGWEETFLKHGKDGKINLDTLTPGPTPTGSGDEDGSGEGNNGDRDKDNTDGKDKDKNKDKKGGKSKGGGEGSSSSSDDGKSKNKKGKMFDLDDIFPISDIEGITDSSVSDNNFSFGDGGDSKKEGKNKGQKAISRKARGEFAEQKDFSWNSIYHAELERNRKLALDKQKTICERREKGNTNHSSAFNNNDTKNKSMSRRRHASRKASKFGRTMMAEHRNKNANPATREDAVSWLKRHSTIAKHKGHDLVMVDLPRSATQDNLEATPQDIRHNPAILKPNHTGCPPKGILSSQFNSNLHTFGAQRKRKIATDEQTFASGLKSVAEFEPEEPQSVFPHTTHLHMRSRPPDPRADKNIPSTSIQYCGDPGYCDSLNSIHASERPTGNVAQTSNVPGDLSPWDKAPIPRRFLWESWVRSKFPKRGGRSTSSWPKNSFLGRNNEIVYTALPQCDDQ